MSDGVSNGVTAGVGVAGVVVNGLSAAECVLIGRDDLAAAVVGVDDVVVVGGGDDAASAVVANAVGGAEGDSGEFVRE